MEHPIFKKIEHYFELSNKNVLAEIRKHQLTSANF